MLVLLKRGCVEDFGEEEALKDLDKGGEEGDGSVALAFVGWLVWFQKGDNPTCLPEGEDDGCLDDVVEEGGDILDGDWT